MATNGANGAAAPDPKLPLFYTAPQRLDSRRHAGKRLASATKLGFAKATNSIPLNGIEFLLAVKHYPIVFTATDPALPVAVVGLRDRENLYVRPDASWESGAYVPAYVRRYPFIFLEDRERGQFVLCIDEASEALSETEGELLFEGDQPGPAGIRGRDFCTAFQAQAQATRAFADAVAAAGLLIENRAQVVLKDRRAMGVSGFRVIDEAKFNALDDATVLDWRRKGWLPLVYCHLISATTGRTWSTACRRQIRQEMQQGRCEFDVFPERLPKSASPFEAPPHPEQLASSPSRLGRCPRTSG